MSPQQSNQTDATEKFLANEISARPESVFALVRSLSRLGPDGMESRTLKNVVAPELGDVPWTENLSVAQTLGCISQDGEIVKITNEQEELASFRRHVRRCFRAFEERGGANALMFSAYRIALGMSLKQDGQIKLGDFVGEVERSSGRERGEDAIRAFNREKANAWLRWMRFTQLAAGAGDHFAPVLLGVVRQVVGELPPKKRFRIQDFLAEIEGEAPTSLRPIVDESPGPLPPATCTALSMLEKEGVVRLSVVGDEDEWLFPDERRAVTHVHIGSSPAS